MDTIKLEPIFDQLVEKVNANMNPADCAKLLYVIGEIKKAKAIAADELRKKMEASPEFVAFSAALKELAIVNIKETEIAQALREITKQVSEDTRETKFVGSFTRNTTTLTYEEADAKKWLIKHKHTEALSIIKKEFEKLAKAAKPNFVTFTEEVQPCLVSDLEKVFAELSEEDILNMLVE